MSIASTRWYVLGHHKVNSGLERAFLDLYSLYCTLSPILNFKGLAFIFLSYCFLYLAWAFPIFLVATVKLFWRINRSFCINGVVMVVPDKSISERENSTGYTNGLPIISSAGAKPVARVGSQRSICKAFWRITPSHSWIRFSQKQY